MLFRSFTSKVASAFALSLVATATWAAPVIDSWDIKKVDGQEQIRVRWSEPAPVEIQKFPAARQAVVRIPTASLAPGELPALEADQSQLLRKLKFQPVALADGSDGVQITVAMDEWRELSTASTPRCLTISYNLANEAIKPKSRILLSNADIEALEGQYGSKNAPEDGAGQAPEGSSEPFASFWVPPELTQAERQRGGEGSDIGLLQTNELMNRYVDLDFKDAELQNLIRSIARKLNLNIIMTPGQVGGRVTVSLNNVRLGDALDALLKANNLSYKLEPGGIVRIVPREEVRGSDKELVTRSIPINWVDAGEVARVIEPFLSGDGEVEYAAESNQLIVKDVPEVVADIQDLIFRLDVPEKQVRMEVRLVDMTESAQREMGLRTKWTNQGFDVVQQLGADGSGGLDGDPVAIAENIADVGLVPEGASALNLIHREDLTIFGETFRIEAEIRAQEDRNEAVTLANPTVLSLNNVPANIEIKRKLPYRDAINSTQGSVATVKFADIGTLVDITPRITNNGFVTMEIATEQKIFVAEDGETGVPIVDERFATTSVTVKDEQTISLGGLRQFESLTSEAGVPWLLRVPVLGWLFKTQSNNQTKLDLYLFVTPHIVKDPEPTVHEMGVYEKIDYNWDLPDYYFEEVRPRKSPAEEVDPRIKGRD